MNLKRTSPYILGAVNLIVATASNLVFAKAVETKKIFDPSAHQLNQDSLKSIESSWLQIPQICKARNFNADPVQHKKSDLAPHVGSIYASYDVQ